jgi:hypothetical protein
VWRGRSAVVGGRLLSREVVRRSRGAQDGGDEARGGPAQADIVEVLSSERRSLVGGERREGRRLVGSERWPTRQADPQLMTTQRCTRRQQRLPAAVLDAWNRGGRWEAERRERGDSGGAER